MDQPIPGMPEPPLQPESAEPPITFFPMLRQMLDHVPNEDTQAHLLLSMDCWDAVLKAISMIRDNRIVLTEVLDVYTEPGLGHLVTLTAIVAGLYQTRGEAFSEALQDARAYMSRQFAEIL